MFAARIFGCRREMRRAIPLKVSGGDIPVRNGAYSPRASACPLIANG
ncbi:hypothetical protein THTE_1496 [Thermogutta terrifontis]|uniref:Uncharacterized protein n=1 Tax=Thermogutta terrifontis TaxID=1331910 RepID=A0A286RDQ6_9BACT|nr:hypothetical protein THTE_1496 [Thermogutta terrifontis]